MCGIFGVINISNTSELKPERVEACLDLLKHRGPNARGATQLEHRVLLGHTRLAIIDLDASSNQPFVCDNRYWTVFNGEIYNYIEIRESLVKLGHKFRTNGDTEVLVRSYIEWGPRCVERFNGMWAFAIYDNEKQTTFCSRDRFGVKPFYYGKFGGALVFSSEIKAINQYIGFQPEPNFCAIESYVKLSTGGQFPDTWFKQIFRLMPAHNLYLQNGEIRIERYWNYPVVAPGRIDFEEYGREYQTILKSALQIRMRSDVPVGFTLSSGLDSTSLVCLLNKEQARMRHTYTASYPEGNFANSEKANFSADTDIGETRIVRRLGAELGFDPTIITVDYRNYVSELRKILWHLESGHGSPAVYPLNQVLARAAQDVTVVIEGQGADELLGGYISSAMPIRIQSLVRQRRFTQAIEEIQAFRKSYSLITSAQLYLRQSESRFWKYLYFQNSGLSKLLTGPLNGNKLLKDYPYEEPYYSDELQNYLYRAHTGGLVNLLHYGDAISMAHSLESRLPYMDYRLVEFAFRTPSELKVCAGLGKVIHRRAMANIVPKYITENKIKIGFDSPLSHLFKLKEAGSAAALLLSNSARTRDFVDRETLQQMVESTQSGRNDRSRILYRLLSVELWFSIFQK